jgi:hypothetical protein
MDAIEMNGQRYSSKGIAPSLAGTASVRRWALTTFIVAMSLVAAVTPATARTPVESSLASFLLKPGDMSGFEPGAPQVFRTAAAVRKVSGESPAKPLIRRYETEGFIEAAILRINGRAERAAEGASSVFEFATPADAVNEMKAELKEELDPKTLRAERILTFLALKHFKVPAVPSAVGYAFVPNKAAKEIGAESGIAKVSLVEGNCLLTIGILRLKSSDVIEPLSSGVRAIHERTNNICP